MPTDNSAGITAAGRPNAKSFLKVDLENAYAQLGISPQASTPEIAMRINTLLAQARRRILAKGPQAGDDPDERELLRLQKIDQQIGDARRRKKYDEKHPQNILLTVQPSTWEQALARHRRAGLISEWLLEEMGQDALLPSPRSLRLWAPAGVGEDVLAFLAEFQRTDSTDTHAPNVTPDLSAGPLTIHDLDTLFEEK